MQYFLRSPSLDAHENLARDELLLEELHPGEVILYLYVNAPAVILGRNQNPYAECDLNRLDADGVRLVRRISGGGAVYHDTGNLNFSFIASGERYNEDRQLGVVLAALKSLGIEAERTGRNDLSVAGRKFSGNAFAGKGNNRQHHGTLLIDPEPEAFARYLTPSPMKLRSKGISSVRARICSLNEIVPGLTVDETADALKRAFRAEYGDTSEFPFPESRLRRLDELIAKQRSWEWRFGETPSFDWETDLSLPQANVRVCIAASGGIVRTCRIYTDSLDPFLPARLEPLLTGKRFDREELIRILTEECKA